MELFPLLADPPLAPLEVVPFDPFFWSITGSFGGPGVHPRPGAIFACARFGLSTRSFLEQTSAAAPGAFALVQQALPLFDDFEVWPDGAVARLHCVFTWDDRQVVEIMDQLTARDVLSAQFAELSPSRTDQGPYDLSASAGPSDSVTVLESAQVVLTQGHQSISFRSFLMGGGV